MFEIWSKIVWVCLGWFWITILKSYFSLNKGIYILYLPFRILYLPNFKYPQTTIFKLYVSLPQHSTPHSLTPSLCPTYTMIPLLRLSTPQESLSYKHNDSLSLQISWFILFLLSYKSAYNKVFISIKKCGDSWRLSDSFPHLIYPNHIVSPKLI